MVIKTFEEFVKRGLLTEGDREVFEKALISYYDPSVKKCPYCFFSCDNRPDFIKHKKDAHSSEMAQDNDTLNPKSLDNIGWRPSKYDDGEWCSRDKDPSLARACNQRGKVVIGLWEYSLSRNGKWLKRRRATLFGG